LATLDTHKAKIMAANNAENYAAEIRTAIAYINDSSNKDIEGLSQSKLYAISELTEQAKPQSPPELPDLNTKLRDICAAKLVEKDKEDKHTEEQNKANNEVMGAFFIEQKSLATKHQEEQQSVNKELQEASSQYERLKTEFKNHETNLAKHRQLLKTLTDSQNEMTQKAEQAGQKLTQLEEKLGLAEEAKRCLKSYLSCSFDNALDSISETATRILRSVPTMATSTVRLEGTKEFGNGSVKDQVTACVDSDGEISVPIKSLSGGERSAVDLAIDLAVAELIQEKANKGIDLMILDEPFGGFDSIGIEHALEMLKTLDKRIVLVEHNPIAKEFVDCKITVIRDGETSYIENKA
jgi:DNA repair exonuclease SbcCD ATPase subunit